MSRGQWRVVGGIVFAAVFVAGGLAAIVLGMATADRHAGGSGAALVGVMLIAVALLVPTVLYRVRRSRAPRPVNVTYIAGNSWPQWVAGWMACALIVGSVGGMWMATEDSTLLSGQGGGKLMLGLILTTIIAVWALYRIVRIQLGGAYLALHRRHCEIRDLYGQQWSIPSDVLARMTCRRRPMGVLDLHFAAEVEDAGINRPPGLISRILLGPGRGPRSTREIRIDLKNYGPDVASVAWVVLPYLAGHGTEIIDERDGGP